MDTGLTPCGKKDVASKVLRKGATSFLPQGVIGRGKKFPLLLDLEDRKSIDSFINKRHQKWHLLGWVSSAEIDQRRRAHQKSGKNSRSGLGLNQRSNAILYRIFSVHSETKFPISCLRFAGNNIKVPLFGIWVI